MTTTNIGVIIVEKSGKLKPLCVKIYNESELYKRCGFKSNNNFQKRGEWSINRDDMCYNIAVYGKNVGRSGFENNYSFPEPLNKVSIFGNCVLVMHSQNISNSETYTINSLTVDFWNSLLPDISTNKSNITIHSDTNALNDNVNLIEEIEKNNSNLHFNNTSSDDDSNVSELVEEEYLLE